LIAAKQKMALETKNMSIAQKEEYERRMAIVEMMVEETQKSLELQHQLEEEAKAAKAAVTAAGSKTGRSILAESAARSWSAESGNENVSSDVLDRAKTLAMTYRRGRVPTADTVQSKYDK
jgi:hypothetical protein